MIPAEYRAVAVVIGTVIGMVAAAFFWSKEVKRQRELRIGQERVSNLYDEMCCRLGAKGGSRKRAEIIAAIGEDEVFDWFYGETDDAVFLAKGELDEARDVGPRPRFSRTE